LVRYIDIGSIQLGNINLNGNPRIGNCEPNGGNHGGPHHIHQRSGGTTVQRIASVLHKENPIKELKREKIKMKEEKGVSKCTYE